MKKTASFPENMLKSRKKAGFSQEEFVKMLNKLTGIDIKRATISNYETGTSAPDIEILPAIAKVLNVSVDYLLGLTDVQANVQPAVQPNVQPIKKTGLKSIDHAPVQVKTIITTTDRGGRETITLVPVKAQAGYLQGSQQKDYIEHLPSFWLPGLNNGTFRAFEVSGYSMLADRIGFFPGDMVIGQYVENLKDIKDGRIYILVNDAGEVDDIVLKRCLNYIDKGGVIICKSDNKDPQYPTFPLPIENIKEVWEFKMKLTRQAPEPSGLYERINTVEGELVLVKEQLKKLLN